MSQWQQQGSRFKYIWFWCSAAFDFWVHFENVFTVNIFFWFDFFYNLCAFSLTWWFKRRKMSLLVFKYQDLFHYQNLFNYQDLSPTNWVRFAVNSDLRWWIAFDRFGSSENFLGETCQKIFSPWFSSFILFVLVPLQKKTKMSKIHLFNVSNLLFAVNDERWIGCI